MRKLLKCKKGVSLMEIIVGMLLFGMVVMTMTAAISPLMLAYNRANDLAEYNQILDAIGNRITSDMAKASSIDPFTSDTDSLTNNITMVIDNITVRYSLNANGQLHIQRGSSVATLETATPVYQQEFYRGKSIGIAATGTSPNFFLEVTVTSTDSGRHTGSKITRPYAVQPLLMS